MRDTDETAAQRLYAAEAPAVQDALAAHPAAGAPALVRTLAGARRAPPRPLRRLVRVLPALRGRDARPPAVRDVPHRGQAPARRRARWASTWSTCRPIHPIGHTFRKGPNNTLTPGPDDPGSPWAIGSEAGGHDTVHPDLGTMEDFEHFMSVAAENGLEIALDFALQASPDHPWVRQPSRTGSTSAPTGPSPTPRTRRRSTRTSTRSPSTPTSTAWSTSASGSCGCGWARACGSSASTTRTPRPCEFWEVLFARIYATDPDVIFLAEAFTRPAMMRTLGTVGFQQSYTYFTWRNTKWELETYFTELSTFAANYMRPNCFVNTPDINPFFLQSGNKAAFAIRATLAALLAPTYGVYAGFEIYEHKALAPGKEEYLDSEKFQYRPRDWAAASHTSLMPYITLLNRIRREHPAFHELRNLRFETDRQPADDRVVQAAPPTRSSWSPACWTRQPRRPGTLHLDLGGAGLRGRRPQVLAHDLITGQTVGVGHPQLHPPGPERHVRPRRRPREDAMTPTDPKPRHRRRSPARAAGRRPPRRDAPPTPAARPPSGRPTARSTGSSTARIPARTRSSGAHPHDGGVTIRVLRPMAKDVVVVTPEGRHPMTHEHRGRLARRAAPARGARPTRSTSTTAQGLIPVRRPLPLPAHAGRAGPAPDRRGPARGAVEGRSGRTSTPTTARSATITGTSFAVWAPSAEGVRVVGDFNGWDGTGHPMRSMGGTGVWELFIPNIGAGTHVQVLDPGQGLGLAGEGRPAGVPHRGAALHRVGRLHVGLRVGRRRSGSRSARRPTSSPPR